MWFSYKEAVTILGKDKADAIFESSWVSKWRQKLTEEEKKDKEYLSMTESAHAKRIHKWLDDIWIKHTHIWSESWQSGSKNIIIMMAKKKALWVSKWFPDYYIKLKSDNFNYNLYIELKKAKWKQWWLNWSSISEEQIWWLKELNDIPFTLWYVCHWSEECIDLINSLTEKLKWKNIEEWLHIINSIQKENLLILNKY